MTILDKNQPYYAQINWEEVKHEMVTEESDIDLFLIYPDILKRIFTVEEILSYTSSYVQKGEFFKTGSYHSIYSDPRAMAVYGTYRQEWVPEYDDYGRPLKDRYGNEKGELRQVLINEVRQDQRGTDGLGFAKLVKNILLHLAMPVENNLFKKVLINLDCGKAYLQYEPYEPTCEINLKTLSNNYEDNNILEYIRTIARKADLNDSCKKAMAENKPVFDYIEYKTLLEYIRNHTT